MPTIELKSVRIIDVTFGRVEVDEEEILRAAIEILSRRKAEARPDDFQWSGREHD